MSFDSPLRSVYFVFEQSVRVVNNRISGELEIRVYFRRSVEYLVCVMKRIIVSPSILAADFGRLGEEVRAAEAAGAGLLHLDIMDGHFVPNISFGPRISRFAIENCTMPAEAHLMVTDPLKWAPEFAKIGCRYITFHEETGNVHENISAIKELGVGVGVAFNPDNDLSVLPEIIGEIDLVLIMSVFPGFGGQEFLESGLKNIEKADLIRREASAKCLIAVDGGIDLKTAPSAVAAGADILVMGSAFFHAESYSAVVKQIASI